MQYFVRRWVSLLWVAAPLGSALLASAVVAAGCSKGGIVPPAQAGMSPLSSELVVARFSSAPRKGPSVDEHNARRAPTRELFGLRARVRGRALPALEALGLNIGTHGEGDGDENGCPENMALVDGRYCVDRYEASVVEILPNGEEREHSPFEPVDGLVVRAVSRPGVHPQGYISGTQAAEACSRSGKRLCSPSEWRVACKGPEKTTYPYGSKNEPGRCNDNGRGPMGIRYGSTVNLDDRSNWTWDRMNDPVLNQMPQTLAPTGSHEQCTNGYGVYDMVGNLHEWTSDSRGTFQGGYYLDTHINGDGCDYRTGAHDFGYHDYSTGFRCCADP